jgi:hypothetical protein
LIFYIFIEFGINKVTIIQHSYNIHTIIDAPFMQGSCCLHRGLLQDQQWMYIMSRYRLEHLFHCSHPCWKEVRGGGRDAGDTGGWHTCTDDAGDGAGAASGNGVEGGSGGGTGDGGVAGD